MNLQKLAREAGVSVSTVSKAFSNAGDISEKTRNRIFAIAKEHGCYGKYIKKKYDKSVIAVICPEIKSEHYNSFIETLKIVIEANNAIMIISEDDFNPLKCLEQIEYFASYLNVDGIITFHKPESLPPELDTPLVVMGHSADKKFSPVNADLRGAIKKAIEHLSTLNHKNIAFIGDNLTISKKQLFADCMNELMLPLMTENLITVNSRFEDAGRKGAERLVATECTAAICAYDYIAFGVIDRLNELGYKVPEDYSIIGMDNIRASEYSREALTTISYPVNEMCESCVSILLKKIKNKYCSDEGVTVHPELVIRRTTSHK